MSLRGKIDRLQKAMQGKLKSFELADGRQYYFDPQEAFKATFLFFTDSMRADHSGEPRPEPPAILQAVAGARDREDALSRALGGFSHILPLDEGALVERGEITPRPLVQGVALDDLGALQDLSEP